MDRPADGLLRSMLQFLALPDQDKLRFLPPMNKAHTYVINECGDRTDNPLFSYCNLALEKMERNTGGSHDEFATLVQDIYSVLALMIEQHAQYAFIWFLDKKACPVSGPADRIWNVLRRLALQALSAKGWPCEFPEVSFAETTKRLAWHRQPPVNERDPGFGSE